MSSIRLDGYEGRGRSGASSTAMRLASAGPVGLAPPSDPARSNWTALDGLRGWAIVSVIAVHLWAHSVRSGNGLPIALDVGGVSFDLTWLFATAHNGVVVFFVLSGFLLYRHWLERRHHMTFGRQWRAFADGRARRILPGLLFYLWLYLVLAAVMGRHRFGSDLGNSNVLLNLTFLAPITNLFHFTEPLATSLDIVPGTWSLNPEIWFYVAMPLLALLLARVSDKWVPWALLLGALTAFFSRSAMGPVPAFSLRFSIAGVFDAFLVGMAAAALTKSYRLNTRCIWFIPVGLGAYVLLCAGKSVAGVDAHLQLCIASGLLIVGLTAPGKSSWKSIFEQDWIVALGHWSYGLFLSNVLLAWYVALPMAQALGVEPGGPLLIWNFAVAGPVMVLAARTTFNCFEQPIMKRRALDGRKVAVQLGVLSAGIVLSSLVFSSAALLRTPDAEYRGPSVVKVSALVEAARDWRRVLPLDAKR